MKTKSILLIAIIALMLGSCDNDGTVQTDSKTKEFIPLRIDSCIDPLNDWTDFLIQFRTLNLGNHENKIVCKNSPPDTLFYILPRAKNG